MARLQVSTFLIFSFFISAYGQEPTPEQQVMIQEIFQGFKDALAPGNPMKRPVFGKDHGCLRGTFTVNPRLPTRLRIGVFKRASYEAWIRFANDGAAAKADTVPAARGMAVKLVGVPGRKILEGSEDALTQDFVMQNHPRFFNDDLKGFRDLIVLPTGSFNIAHPETQPIFDEMDKNVLADPLDGTYWTPVPFKLGEKPVKYKMEPCTKPPAAEPKPMVGDDYLRKNLVEHIQQQDACFKFLIQLQTTEAEMPIDRATVKWDEKKSPFIEFATLKIKKGQNVDDPKRIERCENLSMTAWHSLPEHAPLGSINLARKVVYREIAKIRRTHNHAPQTEPKEIGPNE